MDLDHYQSDLQKESHYEYVLPDRLDSSRWIKQQAHRAMNELEGWCTKEKASVLIDLIILLNAKTVVEIGVFGGKSVIPMAFAVKETNGGQVYGIDPWSATASIDGMEGANEEYWGKLDHEAILQGLISKIHKFNLQDHITLIRNTSAEAPPIYDIDILHIDGNHSDKASLIDVYKWIPLVKKGGVIIFDDLTWNNGGLAVKWLNENCVKLMEYSGENDWGIWIKP